MPHMRLESTFFILARVSALDFQCETLELINHINVFQLDLATKKSVQLR